MDARRMRSAEIATVCLRCDWQGETNEPACPSCGADALYHVGAPSTPAPTPAPSPSEPAEVPATPTEPGTSAGRKRVVAVSAIAVALLLVAATWRSGHNQDPPTEQASPSATVPKATHDADGPPGERFLTRTVGNVVLSLVAPPTWTPSPILRAPRAKIFREGAVGITRSVADGQAAEAIIFWTTLPKPVHVDPCASSFPAVTSSAASLAASMSYAPGIHVLVGPYELRVGGHKAQRMVMRVRADRGCDPGYFFTWRSQCWGQCWVKTITGDEMTVWIVDVPHGLLLIEAETTHGATALLDREIRQIVSSIRLSRAPSHPEAA